VTLVLAPERASPPRNNAAPDLSVAIVNYRSLPLLVQCLHTWQQGTEGIAAELIVLENGTGEAVEDAVRALVPDATVIVRTRSIAFSQAVNEALAVARGRHVALLNPDTLLGQGALAKLCRHLDEHPDTGIVGPRVWDDAARTSLQRSWRSFPGIATALCHRWSLLARVWPGNSWTRRYLRLDAPPGAMQDTDWLSGCCLAVRGELFRELGGLDPRYPMFCEDVDLCRRAGELGYRVVYDPRAEIVHHVGGSRRKAPLRSEWLRHRSIAHYVLKFRGRWNPVAWVLVALVWGRFVLRALTAGRTR
jgi:GT2 family glycosyltransferase